MSIYMDHASATPVDKRIIDFALKYAGQDVGNPSSLYSVGLGAKSAVEDAREKVAALINAETPAAIVFTSSATEANNLAIRGVSQRNAQKGNELVASAIEHISVINSMKELQKAGFKYVLAPVDNTGTVDLAKLDALITPKTVIVSIMYANNEIGTIQPIREISKLVHAKGAYLHVDATAAAGKIPIDVQTDGIDLLTISSNDIGGPQGAAALYIKTGVKIQPVVLGGGQERGLRSGTENIFAIAGFGEAARLAKLEMKNESERTSKIRDALIKEIKTVQGAHLTGHPTNRLPNHASFRFEKIEGESILLNMDAYGIQIATGSACSSKTLEPSHVLLAIGLKHEEAHGSMVITLGKSNNIEQVPEVVKAVKATVDRLRKLSPM